MDRLQLATSVEEPVDELNANWMLQDATVNTGNVNMAKKSTATLGEKIEFRWKQSDEEWRQRLVDSAAEARRPVNSHARELVKVALVNPQETQFQVQQLRREIEELKKLVDSLGGGLEAIHENVYEVRDALLTSVAKILLEAGGMDATKAKEWINRVFNATE